jgi:CRP-like cAMP-binding protein
MAWVTHHDEAVPLIPSGASVGASLLQPWDFPQKTIIYKDNEFVFREGDLPKGLYLIKSGAVKIVVNRDFSRGRVNSPEFVTKLVGPGELFGYKGVITGSHYNYFAKTIRPTEVVFYSREGIDQIMKGPNCLVKMVLTQFVTDLERWEKTNEFHYLASVQERIAQQLLNLADRFGVHTVEGVVINLRLTRNELAQLAATINESLSRHLTELKEEGILDLRGKEIVIKNRQALASKVGHLKT